MASTETVEWIDTDGTAWDLTDVNGYYMPYPGLQGQYGVPTSVVSYVVPGQPGDRVQYLQVAPNDLRALVRIYGEDWVALDQARRALAEAMRPSRGAGVLRHTAHDGATRDLYCLEVSRLRDVSRQTPSEIWVGLQFRAADPYWYDKDATVVSLSPSAASEFFDAPFLPLKLTSGGVSSNFSIINDGQADTWPIFIITGPGTDPTLTNTTTGEQLDITLTLSAGQILTINTDPSVASVLREDGSDQWATVSNTSSLWPLVTGTNVITLEMGGTSGASSLQVQYKRRWEGV